MVPECGVALNSRRDRLDDLNAVRRHTWNPIFGSASMSGTKLIGWQSQILMATSWKSLTHLLQFLRIASPEMPF